MKRELRFSTSLEWATFFIWKCLVYCWWSVSFANSKKSKSLFVILFSGAGGYVSSVNAFLSSLKNKDNLKPFKAAVYRHSHRAFYRHSNYGPTFGDNHDFYISNNANSTTTSFTRFGRTYQPLPRYTYYAPSEVEVFYLQ